MKPSLSCYFTILLRFQLLYISLSFDAFHFVVDLLYLLSHFVLKLKPFSANFEQVAGTSAAYGRCSGHSLLWKGAKDSLGLPVGEVGHARKQLIAVDEWHYLLEIVKCLLLNRRKVLRLLRPFLELGQDEFHAG